ncbi:MAG TPA: PilN domain-containing protein [Geminicoccaceae bacterium]|nr:PilN domain-containing protein [Geminicoccaceae bacterium]
MTLGVSRSVAPFVTLATAFFRWWFAELRACIPERVHQLVGARRPLVAVEFEGHEVRLRRQDGAHWQDIGRLSIIGSDPSSMRQKIVELLAAGGSRKHDIVACVGSDEVLRRRIDLPLEANENLAEVIALELDRFTPLKRPDDVCFDHHVLEIDRVGRRVIVELVVALRRVVEETRQCAQACGLDARRVGVFTASESAGSSFMNLAKGHASHSAPRGGWRIAASLTGVAVILAATAAYIPMQQKEQSLSSYQARIEQIREQADEVNRLRIEVSETLESTQLLASQRQGRPTVIAVLDEITQLLNDDTWLIELKADGDHLVISGYSDAASALVALLDASELLAEVRFNAPVTPDPSLGKERFSLTARITAPSMLEVQQVVQR